jgi:hypothetical protein
MASSHPKAHPEMTDARRLILALLAKGTNAEHVLGYVVALHPEVFQELWDLSWLNADLTLTEDGHIEAEWSAFTELLERGR